MIKLLEWFIDRFYPNGPDIIILSAIIVLGIVVDCLLP
jgi:hypothetical protein